MSIESIVDIIHSGTQDAWNERNTTAFQTLFGAPDGRYPKSAESEATLRAPEMKDDIGVPFAAYIHPSNPKSGPYSGLSFVIFPVRDQPCMVGMGIGTQGLSPDEAILGRPGHARKVQAISAWLNKRYGSGNRVAWAKQDPTRTDLQVPEDIKNEWSAYKSVWDRYGKVMYALFRPADDREATADAVSAFLDLMFEERGHLPLTAHQSSAQSIRDAWFEYLMPGVEPDQVISLLANKRYVVLQGPPGTGKTMTATGLLHDAYGGFGRSIQFHPNTSYENFIGGLAPAHSNDELGLRFNPTPGFLMEAATEALRDPSRNYLLHIDEINRADLGKILGEAIFLLETTVDRDRKINLPYDFGEPFHKTFYLPKNLHILGTMNTADRSIGIVDIAIRRRFAFLSLWPKTSVVAKNGCPITQKAFRELLSIFIEHATADSFPLIPGHSYFLETDGDKAVVNLQSNLAPLLEEYLAQGYVGGFAEQIRSYLQWLRCL
jgi:5-methylcytosine-specific restriction enzyme B